MKDQRILVTGVCGTVGKELVRQLLTSDKYQPKELIGIDNDESGLFFLSQEFRNEPRVNFLLADLRDGRSLSNKCKDIDLIFHTAALKHVGLCEHSPFEAVQTNIIGVQNVINAAHQNNVGRVIFTSSDKAVNPTNVMGTSKLMGERLMTAANSNHRSGGTVFSSTRFGNVLGSNGSVVPIFKKQIAQGGPVTLTDELMSRFIMSIEEAAELVLDSAQMARGGEVFITKMPVICIKDLAKVMIDELAPHFNLDPNKIHIEIIGAKPGEKMYEELMSLEETSRAIELDRYFSVLPAFKGIYRDIDYSYETINSYSVTNPYISQDESPLNYSEIKEFLIQNNLLDLDISDVPTQRFWPGDKAK